LYLKTEGVVPNFSRTAVAVHGRHRESHTQVERIVRKAEAPYTFGVGRSKFDADIAPRLQKVRLGKRCVGFTQSSIERVLAEIVAESSSVTASPVPSAEQQRAARERKREAASKPSKRQRS
jgi:predicted DNA-binding transcriptional regulator AlpA